MKLHITMSIEHVFIYFIQVYLLVLTLWNYAVWKNLLWILEKSFMNSNVSLSNISPPLLLTSKQQLRFKLHTFVGPLEFAIKYTIPQYIECIWSAEEHFYETAIHKQSSQHLGSPGAFVLFISSLCYLIIFNHSYPISCLDWFDI